jgi:uroporphyrin-III C-methyltransferase
MNLAAERGTVYLAGAGPGDPNLLTLRVARLLETADVVLPDDLVSAEVLATIHPGAEIIPVGKRCGQQRVTQEKIHELMIKMAQAGRSVLRLKSGDPLIFGRAAEEIAALRAFGVSFEIVPGITTAFAAAARLKTPLTDRGAASRLILATAHYADGRLELAPKRLGAFPDDSTLVVYMPGRNFRGLADELIASGIDPSTPCVAVSNATTPNETIHASTLAWIEDEEVGPAPVLLLIGHAIKVQEASRAATELTSSSFCGESLPLRRPIL